MNRLTGRVRKPVEREGNEHYVRLTLLSFAASVALTRLFLQLTGYPQLGSSTLHIAHLLWGGLLLFVAALLMMVFANRWVYTANEMEVSLSALTSSHNMRRMAPSVNETFFPTEGGLR